MTLIIGVNLLDKILIASDTRVTITQEDDNLVYDDCVNKTGILWPPVI